MVVDRLSSVGKDLVKSYAEKKEQVVDEEPEIDDIDHLLETDPIYYIGKSLQFLDDPEVEDVWETYESEIDDGIKGPLFRNFMVEEDFEAAAIIAGSDPEVLEEEFREEADTMRRKRSEYGLPEPNEDSNSSERARDALRLSSEAYDLVKGEREVDELYLDEIIPAADNLTGR